MSYQVFGEDLQNTSRWYDIDKSGVPHRGEWLLALNFPKTMGFRGLNKS